jgi:glycosyltransferase involved in cell wall biosynthesis
LVVVDAGSTDDTIKIAKEQDAKIFIETGLLGKVRYSQAEHCTTEWVAFVDSDVYVYPEWWPTVSKYTNFEDVGMVLGFADAPIRRFPVYDVYLKHMAKKFGAAAFSNSLVRRRLMLSCKELLRNVHAGEDTVLARHIALERKRIITVPIRLCFHDKDPVDDHPKAMYRWGESSRIAGGLQGPKNIAKTLRNSLRNWGIFTKETGCVSITLLIFLIYLWLCMLRGYIGLGPKRSH